MEAVTRLTEVEKPKYALSPKAREEVNEIIRSQIESHDKRTLLLTTPQKKINTACRALSVHQIAMLRAEVSALSIAPDTAQILDDLAMAAQYHLPRVPVALEDVFTAKENNGWTFNGTNFSDLTFGQAQEAASTAIEYYTARAKWYESEGRVAMSFMHKGYANEWRWWLSSLVSRNGGKHYDLVSRKSKEEDAED